jgi:hypothetical protein
MRTKPRAPSEIPAETDAVAAAPAVPGAIVGV